MADYIADRFNVGGYLTGNRFSLDPEFVAKGFASDTKARGAGVVVRGGYDHFFTDYFGLGVTVDLNQQFNWFKTHKANIPGGDDNFNTDKTTSANYFQVIPQLGATFRIYNGLETSLMLAVPGLTIFENGWVLDPVMGNNSLKGAGFRPAFMGDLRVVGETNSAGNFASAVSAFVLIDPALKPELAAQNTMGDKVIGAKSYVAGIGWQGMIGKKPASAPVAQQKKYFPDADSDGFGDATNPGTLFDEGLQTPGWVLDNKDCNDAAYSTENDCSDKRKRYYPDVDQDGFGDATNPGTLFDEGLQTPRWVLDNADCNDGNSAIHPSATEECNGVDDDCNGTIDIKVDGVSSCGRVVITDTEIKILEKVFFDTNKTTIKPASFSVLNEVAAVLIAHPFMIVEVQGHTDSVGGFGANQILSDGRADSVKKHLIKQGVPAAQLTAKGYGETVLIDQPTRNDYPSEANRRVQFIILEQ